MKLFRKKFKRNQGPILKSFYHAFEGIKSCLIEERNMFIHFCIMCLVIICGIIFKISIKEWIICIVLFSMVLSLELVNTAIETTVDICSPEINPKAKLAKDVAAGAVLVSAISSAIIGLLIFVPKLIEFVGKI